jgi:hypothetical protein
MENPPYSPDSALDIWLFPEIKSPLKGRTFQDTHTESYSTSGVQKMFPTVAASLG